MFGMIECVLKESQEITRMATAILDQAVSDTLIEQLGCGAPMQHFPHRGTPLLMERAVLVAQLHHGQPEGGREALSYTCHFVTR